MGAVIVRAFLGIAALSVPLLSSADQTDDFVKRAMEKWHIAGLSLAVVRDGKVVKVRGYGFANVETGTRATAETVYKIGSVSKQFLASAILLLAGDRKLSLHDSASNYLDGCPATWKEITVENLLHHTSGLPEDPPGYDPYKTQSDAEMIKSAYSTPLLFKPGEKLSYSNLGYFVLAEIIRKVSGEPWDQFVRERIFAPAGMIHTLTTSASAIIPDRASGYSWKFDHLEHAEDTIAVRPSGAFLSTALDMAKWDSALTSHSVLSPSIEEQLWTPALMNDGSLLPYGCGWGLGPWFGHKRVAHNGYLPGFLCDFERFVDDKITVIVLTNTVSGDPSMIACKVAGFFAPDLVLKPIPDKNPTLSANVRSMVLGLANDSPDFSLFTADLAAWLKGDGKGVGTAFKDRGSMKSIDLISGTGKSPPEVWYRVQYTDDALLLRIALTADGKISGFGFQDG